MAERRRRESSADSTGTAAVAMRVATLGTTNRRIVHRPTLTTSAVFALSATVLTSSPSEARTAKYAVAATNIRRARSSPRSLTRSTPLIAATVNARPAPNAIAGTTVTITPRNFPTMTSRRGIGVARMDRSVPRSRSPTTASNVSSIVRMPTTTCVTNRKSRLPL